MTKTHFLIEGNSTTTSEKSFQTGSEGLAVGLLIENAVVGKGA